MAVALLIKKLEKTVCDYSWPSKLFQVQQQFTLLGTAYTTISLLHKCVNCTLNQLLHSQRSLTNTYYKTDAVLPTNLRWSKNADIERTLTVLHFLYVRLKT
jgi:hypothetical protein